MTRKGSSEKDVVNCIPETQMPPPIHDSHWSSDKDTVELDKYDINISVMFSEFSCCFINSLFPNCKY